MNWLTLLGAFALAGSSLLTQGEDGGPDDNGTTAQPVSETSGRLDPQDRIGAAGPAVEQDVLTDTLALEAERNFRLTVPVTIMGQGPFRFMVDTGAQATVLSSELADQLQLYDRESALLVGMASSRAVETTMVPEFALGARTFTVRVAPIVEGSNIGRADGILGLDSLQDQRVLFDFDNDEMHISDSFGAGGSRSYDIIVRARERLGQLVIHRARVNGVRTAVIIDTGAQSSIGNLALRNRMRGRSDMADTLMTDVNGIQINGQTRIVDSMDMGDVRLTNFPVAFADAPTFAALGLTDRPAMILGMSELRVFSRVAIDFRSNRVLFELPDSLTRDQSWNFNHRATNLR